ncbi:MAG TPA: M48 family metalloprotease [Candidatus Acidoferrum sp.]|nr:M48 family metalloprotease [Candidatus Acidoferrum sp.]
MPTKPSLLQACSLALSLVLLLPGQATVAQINLPVLGDEVSGTISTQEEYEFGREFLRTVRKQTPALNDPLVAEYISSVTYRLAVNSELTDHRLDFVLIDSKELNAFAAPGGVVGVNAGLFLYAENEGQFASVLAHELAHLSQRHYARSVQDSRNNTLPTIAGLLASIAIAATVGGDAGQAALMANQAHSIDNQLRFSRSHEQEADRVGIRTLYNAGFDPQDMVGMFESMERSHNISDKLPEFMSTHPLDASRIIDSRNRANSMPKVTYIQNPEFLLMRERVRIHYAKNADAEILERKRALPQLNGAAADAANYGIALAQVKTGQYIAATETLSPLLAKEPNRISYVILNAEIAMAANDYTRAGNILEAGLKFSPGNHPLTMAYATALTKSKRYKEAATVLEQHALDVPNDPQVWSDLAEVEGLAGNIKKVHQARAEYFITIGDFVHAKEHLNYAMQDETDKLVLARLRQRLDYIRNIEKKYYR